MTEFERDLEKHIRDRDMAIAGFAGRQSGRLVQIASSLIGWATFGEGTDDGTMERIAREMRESGEEFTDMFGPSSMARIVWDRNERDFYRAEECALCPSDAERDGNGLCSSCRMAEHGEGIEEAREMLHSESEVD